MTRIQILLLLGIAVSAILTLTVLRQKIFGKLFFLAQFVLGIIFILSPDTASAIARFLGVGRGTDLLLYLFILLFYFTSLCIAARFRKLEQRQTELARSVALLTAQKLANGTTAQDTKAE